MGCLVGFVRDGAADSASSQVGAVFAGGASLVGADSVRSGPRPSCIRAGDADLLQDRLELRRIAPLPGCDHDGHRLLALLDSQVQLGRQTAARAAEALLVQFNADPAGRLLLQIPLFRAPAACWWAWLTVESMLRSQVMRSLASACACSAAKSAARCRPAASAGTGHRPGPTAHSVRSGTSRHGAPVRVRNRMPSIICRRVHTGGRPGFLPWGNSGSRRAHCTSIRSPRTTKQDHFTS